MKDCITRNGQAAIAFPSSSALRWRSVVPDEDPADGLVKRTGMHVPRRQALPRARPSGSGWISLHLGRLLLTGPESGQLVPQL